MNISGTLNAFKLLYKPALILPHATVSTFNDLPIPISQALPSMKDGAKPDIRAVVLDKDNCFAEPDKNAIYEPYEVRVPTFSVLYYKLVQLYCMLSFKFSTMRCTLYHAFAPILHPLHTALAVSAAIRLPHTV